MAYDAVYIALAEALDAALLTRDRRLARASCAVRARVNDSIKKQSPTVDRKRCSIGESL
jgi:predicted nucleic acid-binding protein